MIYPYVALDDNAEILHAHIIQGESGDRVEVHFEHPVAGGFASARYSLPSYEWKLCEGYSDEDIVFFEELLHYNAHLFF